LIAENADPKPDDIVELQRGQGILGLSWEMSRTLAEQSGLYPTIANYFADANSHYSTMHSMIQNLFYVPEAREERHIHRRRSLVRAVDAGIGFAHRFEERHHQGDA